MPKLPVNFVKAPGFDNPLRATGGHAGHGVAAGRELVLSLDETSWDALMAASEREGESPEAIVRRALGRWLSEVEGAVGQQAVQPSRRAQLIDQLIGQLGRRSWGQCLGTLRVLVREGRGGKVVVTAA